MSDFCCASVSVRLLTRGEREDEGESERERVVHIILPVSDFCCASVSVRLLTRGEREDEGESERERELYISSYLWVISAVPLSASGCWLGERERMRERVRERELYISSYLWVISAVPLSVSGCWLGERERMRERVRERESCTYRLTCEWFLLCLCQCQVVESLGGAPDGALVILQGPGLMHPAVQERVLVVDLGARLRARHQPGTIKSKI